MRAKSFEGMACSIAMVLDAVGDRWAMLVLRDLAACGATTICAGPPASPTRRWPTV